MFLLARAALNLGREEFVVGDGDAVILGAKGDQKTNFFGKGSRKANEGGQRAPISRGGSKWNAGGGIGHASR